MHYSYQVINFQPMILYIRHVRIVMTNYLTSITLPVKRKLPFIQLSSYIYLINGKKMQSCNIICAQTSWNIF